MAAQQKKKTSQQLYIHTHCPQCGSEMVYEGGRQKRLKCRNCNYSRALNKHSDQVVNQQLQQGVKLNQFIKGLGLPTKAYFCTECTAEIAMYDKSPLTICPFCTSDQLEPSDRDKEVFRPYSMIPFTISQDYAIKKLRNWLGMSYWGAWFFPGSVFGMLEPPKMRGVYLPVFLFDALTRNSWIAEAGLRFEDEKKGKKVSRMIWDPTVGYYEHFFEELEIGVSEGIDQVNLEDILPYDFRMLVPYDTRFLEDNWTVELYQIPEMEGFKLANMSMDTEIMTAALERIIADDVRKLKITSEKLSIAFKHVLVPVWIGSYAYEGEVFQFMVNGQTGEIAGEKPLATYKMYIAVAIAVVLMILLVLLFSW